MLFGVATLIVAWVCLGLALGWPTEWFVLSNMMGTSATLLLLLLMPHSQNRDMHALQAKVDELIRSSETAANDWIGSEKCEAHELAQMVADRQENT